MSAGGEKRRRGRPPKEPRKPIEPSMEPWIHPERPLSEPQPKRKPGRPRGTWTKPYATGTALDRRHRPNEEMRRTIANMASYGLDVLTISKLISLSPSTIYRHYKIEMQTAAAKKDLMVLQSAFLKAVGGPDQNWEKADAAMQRWWISVRQSWQLPATRNINANINLDLTKLSDAQLDELERIMEQAALDDRGYSPREGGEIIEAEQG
jgi:hypothetical protein